VRSLRQRTKLPDLNLRLEALRKVVDLARDRLDPKDIDRARRVLERGTERMDLGRDLTVVAIAGPTGSGKSSLFNLLCGEEISQVGVLRPTTDSALACSWGEASRVLDWLGVSRRHRLDDPELEGLVLVDLPDHDSTQHSHRREMERLIQLVDVFLWVVDPQKYADAAIHDYLRPMHTHAAVTLLVLNQADRLSESARRQCVQHLSSLLRADGLPGVRLLSTSAVTGEGIDELRSVIAARVQEERAAAERLSADIDQLAGDLQRYCDPPPDSSDLRGREREQLIEALADAAGVPAVVDAVARSHRREAALAAGWPFTRWVRHIRPDPLVRLHLGPSSGGGKTSLPPATNVQRAQVENAIRALANSAGSRLAAPWPDLVKARASASLDEVLEGLDHAVGDTRLGGHGRPKWWSVAGAVQILLAITAALGFAWLSMLFALEWFQIPRPPTPEVERIPWPTILLVGGLAAGLVLGSVFGQLARIGALRKRKGALQRLYSEVGRVADLWIVRPIESELSAHASFCQALAAMAAR
jgi:GTP-binding protein EngB required for normal cell division